MVEIASKKNPHGSILAGPILGLQVSCWHEYHWQQLAWVPVGWVPPSWPFWDPKLGATFSCSNSFSFIPGFRDPDTMGGLGAIHIPPSFPPYGLAVIWGNRKWQNGSGGEGGTLSPNEFQTVAPSPRKTSIKIILKTHLKKILANS